MCVGARNVVQESRIKPARVARALVPVDQIWKMNRNKSSQGSYGRCAVQQRISIQHTGTYPGEKSVDFADELPDQPTEEN
jgi:hypothetical protein